MGRCSTTATSAPGPSATASTAPRSQATTTRTPNAFLSSYPAAPVADPTSQFINPNCSARGGACTDVQEFNSPYRTPLVQQFNLNIQRDLGRNFVLQVSYIRPPGPAPRLKLPASQRTPLSGSRPRRPHPQRVLRWSLRSGPRLRNQRRSSHPRRALRGLQRLRGSGP